MKSKNIPFHVDVNKKAPAYEKLAKVLGKNKKDIEVFWHLRKDGSFDVYGTSSFREPVYYQFTASEIKEVSFILYQNINTCALEDVDTGAQIPSADLLWDHVHSPYVLIDKNPYSEIWLKDITEISELNLDNKVIYDKYNRYALHSFTDYKSGLLSIGASFGYDYEDWLNLCLIEKNYPGLTAEVNVALSLELSPAEVASVAIQIFNKSHCSTM